MLSAPPFWAILPIFRAPFLERIAHQQHRSTIEELADCFISYSPPSETAPLKKWFDFFYELLSSQYRCEYIYKNTIATRLYLDRRHSLNESLLTNELRSGNSRADIVILNGTSTVYEIKSEYDSFKRLDGQLQDYRRIYDRIYVVTSSGKAIAVADSVDPLIGVLALRDDGVLDEIRDAQTNKANTDPAEIFNCMRREEYCSAIRDVFKYVPDVPNSELYCESRKLFCRLDPQRAHDLMVDKVKVRGRRQSFVDLIHDAPNSLKHSCLSFSKSQALAVQIRQRLEEPLSA